MSVNLFSMSIKVAFRSESNISFAAQNIAFEWAGVSIHVFAFRISVVLQTGIVYLTTSLAFSKISVVLTRTLHGRSIFGLLDHEAVPECRPFVYRILMITLLDQLFERQRRVLLRSPPDWEDLNRDEFPLDLSVED